MLLEFLIVNSNKLKIMLDKTELAKYGLDKEELDYSEPEVRNSFWDILDIAEQKCGFHCKGEKILIQFYPSKSGGEIFITKLGLLSKSAERSLVESERVAMLSSEMKIYKFEGIDSIAMALHINRKFMPEKIRVYLNDTGEYYLIFDERNSGAVASMSEFASKIPSEIESYIIERTEEVEKPYETFEKYYSRTRE